MPNITEDFYKFETTREKDIHAGLFEFRLIIKHEPDSLIEGIYKNVEYDHM